MGPIIGRVVQGDELTRLYPEVCWSGYYNAICNSITCLIIHFRKRREVE